MTPLPYRFSLFMEALAAAVSQLKRELKTWERDFEAKYGRKPSKDDIKADPATRTPCPLAPSPFAHPYFSVIIANFTLYSSFASDSGLRNFPAHPAPPWPSPSHCPRLNRIPFFMLSSYYIR